MREFVGIYRRYFRNGEWLQLFWDIYSHGKTAFGQARPDILGSLVHPDRLVRVGRHWVFGIKALGGLSGLKHQSDLKDADWRLKNKLKKPE